MNMSDSRHGEAEETLLLFPQLFPDRRITSSILVYHLCTPAPHAATLAVSLLQPAIGLLGEPEDPIAADTVRHIEQQPRGTWKLHFPLHKACDWSCQQQQPHLASTLVVNMGCAVVGIDCVDVGIGFVVAGM